MGRVRTPHPRPFPRLGGCGRGGRITAPLHRRRSPCRAPRPRGRGGSGRLTELTASCSCVSRSAMAASPPPLPVLRNGPAGYGRPLPAGRNGWTPGRTRSQRGRAAQGGAAVTAPAACLRKSWTWRSVPWSARHGGVQSQVELDDLRGLFQPKRFCYCHGLGSFCCAAVAQIPAEGSSSARVLHSSPDLSRENPECSVPKSQIRASIRPPRPEAGE